LKGQSKSTIELACGANGRPPHVRALSSRQSAGSIIADGKEVGHFNSSSASGIDLSTVCGADLSGLETVQSLEVVLTDLLGATPTLFKANLLQTGAALEAIKKLAKATAPPVFSETDGSWHVTASLGWAEAWPTQAATVTTSAKLDPSLKPSTVYIDVNTLPTLA
jgi:hypothetical protein